MEPKNYLFLIGAPKAGTSSLSAALAQHPDVCVSSSKEPRYFTDFARRDWSGPGISGFLSSLAVTREDFEATFGHNAAAPWRVDASTDYLHCDAAVERISQFRDDPTVGTVKVVVVLRDPIDRAVSQYQHTVRDGFERGSLEEAIVAEDERRNAGFHPLFHHVGRSRYHAALLNWRAHFPDLLVLDYHELQAGVPVASRIFDAMGLDVPGVIAMPRENQSYDYKVRALGAFVKQRGLAFNLARSVLPAPVRRQLRETESRWNRVQYEPAEHERRLIGRKLLDDIEPCLTDPTIPTAGWKTSRWFFE